jgi:hypothetical protein
MLTDQDRAFLRKLKAKGKTKEEAKEILLGVKTKQQQAANLEKQKQPQNLGAGLWDSTKNLVVDGGKTALNLAGTGANLITFGNANVGYGTENRFKDDLYDKSVEGAKEGFQKGNQLRKDTVDSIEEKPGIGDDAKRLGANLLGVGETIVTTLSGAGGGALEDIVSPTFQGTFNGLSDENKQRIGGKMQEINDWYNNQDEDTKLLLRHLGVVGDGLLTFGTAGAGKTGVSGAKTIVKQADDVLKPVIKEGLDITARNLDAVGSKITNSRQGVSAQVLNSMNKVIPTKQREFIQMSGGDTVGDYLLKRDIIGNPTETIEQLAGRFTEAKNRLDTGIAQVQGVYKPQSARVVLEDMLDFYKATADRKNLNLTQKRLDKFEKEGLTLTEINNIKRDFESGVRLGYLRDNNGVKIERNTNLDNALRADRNEIAKVGGFNNIDELSKEIQLSKSAMDSIADKQVRQAANNNLSLTDNMSLIGGAIEPGAATALLGKKFLSSDIIKKKLAQALSSKDMTSLKELDIVPERIIGVKNKQKQIQEYKQWLDESGWSDLIRQTEGRGNTQKLLPEGNSAIITPEPKKEINSDLTDLDERQAKVVGDSANQQKITTDNNTKMTREEIIAKDEELSEQWRKAVEEHGLMSQEARDISKKRDELSRVSMKLKEESKQLAKSKEVKVSNKKPEDPKTVLDRLSSEIEERNSYLPNTNGYNNFDSYLEAHTVFHGADAKFAKVLRDGKKWKPDAEREAATGGNRYGLSTTTDYQMAKDFSTSVDGKGDIVELYIEPGARTIELKEKTLDDLTEAETARIAEQYDVIIDGSNIGGENEVRVLKPEALVDRKRLEQYFKQGQAFNSSI